MTGALGTLGVLAEISLKCLPLPKAEATRVLECDADEAIRRVNEWGGKPLPLSATCHHAGRLAVRLSGAAPAVAAAAARRSAARRWPTATRSGAACASRRIRSSPPRGGRRARCGGCRCKSTAPFADLGGEQLIEWGGALRWLDAERAHDPATLRAWAQSNGGHATLFRAADKVGRRVPAAAGGAAAIAPAAEGDVRSRRHPQSAAGSTRISEATVQTALADFIRDTPEGQEADAILRTLRALRLLHGDLPDLPAAGRRARRPARAHLPHQAGARGRRRSPPRRSCTSTAASPAAAARRPARRASQYGRLLDIGRHVVERACAALGRRAGAALGDPRRGCWRGRCSAPRWRSGRRCEAAAARRRCAAKIPDARPAGAWPAARHARKMLALDGCVQARWRRRSTPRWRACSTASASRSSAVAAGGCCGALPYHLDATRRRRSRCVKRNIDAWWPHVERGAEAIVVTASGCGVMVKDYGHLLRARPGVRGEGAADRATSRATPVEVIARRVAADRAEGRDGRRAAEGRVPFAVHAAARDEAQGPRRGDPAGAGPRAHAGAPTRTCAAARPARTRSCSRSSRGALQGRQAGGARGGAARRHRDRQHRLPHAPRRRHASGRCGTGSSCSTRGWWAASARRCSAPGRPPARIRPACAAPRLPPAQDRARATGISSRSRRAGWTTTATATSTT